jgi:GDP-L-fucose synthase
MGFWSKQRVLVTGGTGFLGQHLVAALKATSPAKLSYVGSRDFDLTESSAVVDMFKEHQPTVVFHLAGLVGGILANKLRPADFFYKNLMMGTLVFHEAWRTGVSSYIMAGAGCGYPENAPMPLREADLWSGFPQKESSPYSLAKRLLSIQSAAYQSQHRFNSVVCIPGNIYGEYDNFNLQDSHVIPGLVRKFIEAKNAKSKQVEVWGSGTPTRDFVYAGDVAKGMVRAAELCGSIGSDVINLSSGTETSVRQVCELLKQITGFQGEIYWDSSKPSGQARRHFNVEKAKEILGFTAETPLADGLEKTVRWFVDNQATGKMRL